MSDVIVTPTEPTYYRDVGDCIVLTIPKKYRARIYAAGGIGYDRWVDGPGWVVDEEPDDGFEYIAWATRRQTYPTLTDIV